MEKADIPGKDNYFVSMTGDVYRLNNGTLEKKVARSVKGYLCIRINKLPVSIHRLVAKAYVPNPENKPQVNHKDGNKQNNCYWNLEWVTHQENTDHAFLTGLSKGRPPKLTDNQIIEIFLSKEKQPAIALKFGIHIGTVEKIKAVTRRGSVTKSLSV